MRVTAHHFSQMRAENADRIHHRVAGFARSVHVFRRNPHGRDSERRLARGNAFDVFRLVVGVDGQLASMQQFEARDLYAFERKSHIPAP